MSKRAVIVYGGLPAHTPKECADLFASFLREQNYEVTLSDTLETYADESVMGAVDLIVPIWTLGELTSEQWQGLDGAVRGGAGIAGFHGGIVDAFRGNVGYQFMTGGQFVGHPGNLIPSYTVNIVDREHEITRGIEDFELTNTEQYYMIVDPGAHVLATTTFSGEHGDNTLYAPGTVMPYAWTRQWGAGRVFVAAWGHTHEDFDVPEARQIVERGLLWASA